MKTKTLNLSFLKPLLLVACFVMCCGNAWGSKNHYYAHVMVGTHPTGNNVVYADIEAKAANYDSEGMKAVGYSSYYNGRVNYTLTVTPKEDCYFIKWRYATSDMDGNPVGDFTDIINHFVYTTRERKGWDYVYTDHDYYNYTLQSDGSITCSTKERTNDSYDNYRSVFHAGTETDDLDNAQFYKAEAVMAVLKCDQPEVFSVCENQTQYLTVTHANMGTITLSTNSAQYSVNPTTITSTEDLQTTTITITYDPTQSATANPTLTLASNADLPKFSTSGTVTTQNITKTIALPSKLCKPTVTWIGDNLKKEESYNLIAAISDDLGYTLSLYSNGNDSISTTGIGTFDANNQFTTAEEGDAYVKITVTATPGYEQNYTEVHKFIVSSKNAQTIEWNQYFTQLYLGDADIELTAIAKYQGNPTGKPISYTFGNATDDANYLYQANGKTYLKVPEVDGWSGKLTASVQGDADTYLPDEVTRDVLVRKKALCSPIVTITKSPTNTTLEQSIQSSTPNNINNPIIFNFAAKESQTLSFKLKVGNGDLKKCYVIVKGYTKENAQGTSFDIQQIDCNKQIYDGTIELSFPLSRPDMRSVEFFIQGLELGNFKATVSDVALHQLGYLNLNPSTLPTQNIPLYASKTVSVKVNYSAQPSLIVRTKPEYAQYVKIVEPATVNADGYHYFENIDCDASGTAIVKLEISSTFAVSFTDVLTVENSEIYDDELKDEAKSVQIEVPVNIAVGDTYYFVGEDTECGDCWDKLANWKLNNPTTGSIPTELPSKGNPVEIVTQKQANILATKNEDPEQADIPFYAEIYSLKINSNSALSVAPGCGISVYDGGVNNNGELTLQAGRDSGNAYLRVMNNNQNSTKQAIDANVELYTKAYYNPDSTDNSASWQYIGSPLTQSSCPQAQDLFYGAYLYQYDKNTSGTWGWASIGNQGIMEPFRGYTLTQDEESEGKKYTFTGTLNMDATTTYSFAALKSGKSICVANSYAAPIYISGFEDSDFHGFDPVIHLFCTGSYSDWQKHIKDGDDKFVLDDHTITYIDTLQDIAAGTYISVPVSATKLDKKLLGKLTIPSTQGFMLYANSDKQTTDRSISFNYDRLVWHQGENPTVLPMFAPAQYVDNQTNITKPQSEDELTARIEMMVVGDDQMDMLCLFEAPGFDDTYEAGYDGKKKFPSSDVPFLYTSEAAGELMVSAIDDLDGMVLGFDTPDRDNDTILTYTLSFFSILGEEYYLHDNLTNLDVLMTEGAYYTFTAPASTYNPARFTIGSTPRGTVTEMDEELNDSDIRIWQRGEQVCASVNSNAKQTLTLCDMQGHMIASVPFVSTCTYNMSYLPAGVYTATVGNQTVKVVR